MDRTTNVFGEPPIPPNERWGAFERNAMQRQPVVLNCAQREATLDAIVETCAIRAWTLHAANIRTNHGHVVVTSPARIATVLNAFKANATRVMRRTGVWVDDSSPWSRGGSRRYIWSYTQLSRAIRYVVEGQGDDLS